MQARVALWTHTKYPKSPFFDLFLKIPMIDGQYWYYFDVIFIKKIQALLEVLVLCFSKQNQPKTT